jgi:uncharacterized protein (DUF983 family)
MSHTGIGSVLMGHRLADTVPVQLAVDVAGFAVVAVVLLILGVTTPLTWIVLPVLWLVFTAVRALIVAHRVRTAAGRRDPS